MKKLPLIMLITLGLASNALAADYATPERTLNEGKGHLSTPIKKNLPRSTQTPVKDAYAIKVVGNIKTTTRGQWEYTVAIHNTSKTRVVESNTLEVVVLRKGNGGEALLGTHPITSELKTYGVQGNNFVITSAFPYCCSAPTHEVKVRLRGSNAILAATTMHTGSLRTLTMTNDRIANGGTTCSFKINQRAKDYREAIVKPVFLRNGKYVELGQQSIVIPPGDSAFTIPCGKVGKYETPSIKAYAKTTCANDTPDQCFMGQSHGVWQRQ